MRRLLNRATAGGSHLRSGMLGLGVTGLLLVVPALAQAHPGDPDTSFGSNGIFLQQLGQGTSGSNPQSLFADDVVQSDGKIVSAGPASMSSGSGYNLAVQRELPNGTLDPSFASGGDFVQPFGSAGVDLGEGEIFTRLAIAPDGSIVVAVPVDDGGHIALAVVRLTPGGTLDNGFGSGGVEIQQFGLGGSPVTLPTALVVQPDGRIVVVGETTDAAGHDVAFAARFATNGNPDPGFGTGGVFTHSFSQSATFGSAFTGVLLQPDGSLIVGGFGPDTSSNGAFFLAGLTSGGGLNGSFPITFEQVGQSGTPTSLPVRLAAQPGGKFVESGQASDGNGHTAVGLARFNANGSIDSSFGTGGNVVVQPSTASTPNSIPVALAVQGNGKLLVSGEVAGSGTSDPLTILRFTADGHLDPSFGNSGVVSENLGDSPGLAVGFGLAIAGDGQLDLAGGAVFGGHLETLVARFLLDQPPTASFSFSPASPTVGQAVSFDASGSSDADGTVSAIDWDMGSGSFTDAHGAKPSFTFTTPGAHTVRLRVTDDDGLTAVASQTVTVAPAPVAPVAPVVVKPVVPPAPGLLAFGGMTLGSRVLGMDKHGNVFVTLSCPLAAVSPCAGTVTLSGESDGSAPRALVAAKKKAKPKLFTFGSASFTVAAGKSVRVKVHLSTRAQGLIRRKHRLTAKLVVKDHDQAGRSSTTSARVTIKAPPAKKKK